MRVKIQGPQQVRGSIEPPSSKAYTHRALVASLLANGTSSIEKPSSCDDIERTIEGIKSLGAQVARGKETIRIVSSGLADIDEAQIQCGESGATLRFLTAVCAAFPTDTTLTATGSLSTRPLILLLQALKTLGARAELQQDNQSLCVKVGGTLKGGSVSIPGNISSQFISGLLLAAPSASKNVEIRIPTRLESRPYVELTLEIMRKHEVNVEILEDGFRVPAPHTYSHADHVVPTDFSSAAFALVAGITMGEGLELQGVRDSPVEPDFAILSILEEMGVKLGRSGPRIDVPKTELDGFSLDAHDHPDLVPALEVLACHAKGRSEIRGVERLVHKESNRLMSLPEELKKMRARIDLVDDRIVVEGGMGLRGGDLRSHQDHRVAMACATASLAATGATTIDQAEVVSKSYPGFYEDLERMGVALHVE